MKDLFINGSWVDGESDAFDTTNPSTGDPSGEYRSASPEQVGLAFEAAADAFPGWSSLSVTTREEHLTRYATALKSHREELSGLISDEIGKPPWEANSEVSAMIGKVAISIDAFALRCGAFQGGLARTEFRPHGVVGVLGPFNFPGHLPNGHLVPALLAGNTAVFKPSELAPGTAAKMVQIWEESGLPKGVLNLLQGGRNTGQALVEHERLDGLFFTGSAQVGEHLRQTFAQRPGKILALELGGNNPLIVEPVAAVAAAVAITIQSAFLTAGQRCTCARRLILPRGAWGDAFLEQLGETAKQLVVGPPDNDPAPFMGPVVSANAADQVLAVQDRLLSDGACSLLSAKHLRSKTGLLQPGILEVTEVEDRADEEVFGPLLQVIRVANWDEAIVEANATEFGLAAGLISDDEEQWLDFKRQIRAGVVNWNQQTTGASSAAPFGGIGRSGNFRPSAFFAADYCSWPMASIAVPDLSLPDQLPPGLTIR